MTGTIFCVQDKTGTAAQLALDAALPHPVVIGDAGTYTGPDPESDVNAPITAPLPFTVGQVLDTTDFGITTLNIMLADWPHSGAVTWTRGANTGLSPATLIDTMTPANAYIDANYFKQYHKSRGNSYGTPTSAQLQAAIVQATDYLDQRYRFKGIKLVQYLGNPALDPMFAYINPWMQPFVVFGSTPYLTPSKTSQQTEWPRQGVVDYNGDTITGVPRVVMNACAELALRSVNGASLQPDYDPDLVRAGGIAASVTEDVGPIRTTTTYDTKLGLGFFPSIPQVDRMLSKAGLLVAGGRRQLIR